MPILIQSSNHNILEQGCKPTPSRGPVLLQLHQQALQLTAATAPGLMSDEDEPLDTAWMLQDTLRSLPSFTRVGIAHTALYHDA